MRPLERRTRLAEIHLLIKQGKTGRPIEFAKKFHISRSHLYNIIDVLKYYGAAIKYSRKHQTFYYNNDFKITSTPFWEKEITDFLGKKDYR
jgi:predicted DNA-binding transcriptional regulator YafY